ncbi:MAG: biotin--[acetyl-CoA-carboxylase] ligase [Bacteroidales bacterium]|nr:biotin--[acetyl-CoA-carboxylase] ligase [Bacteroidales bacterium]
MNLEFYIKTIQETESTNLLMLDWKKKGLLKSGVVLRAINQTGGIGQRGNFWESERGKNLTFSLYLETSFISATDIFQLNKLISLSVYDYLLNKKIVDVKIKWPNDIYIANKKVAGMLTHNSLLGDKLEYSIIGLGLNINQLIFQSDAPNPISLKKITAVNYDLEKELKSLLSFVKIRFEQITNGKQNKLNTDYLGCLYGFGEKRQFKDEFGEFNGTIKGVDSYGRLLIEKDTKKLFTYDVKSIEFL